MEGNGNGDGDGDDQEQGKWNRLFERHVRQRIKRRLAGWLIFRIRVTVKEKKAMDVWLGITTWN